MTNSYKYRMEDEEEEIHLEINREKDERYIEEKKSSQKPRNTADKRK